MNMTRAARVITDRMLADQCACGTGESHTTGQHLSRAEDQREIVRVLAVSLCPCGIGESHAFASHVVNQVRWAPDIDRGLREATRITRLGRVRLVDNPAVAYRVYRAHGYSHAEARKAALGAFGARTRMPAQKGNTAP
jgi:hypothetical protein